jgi:hypothetical protein
VETPQTQPLEQVNSVTGDTNSAAVATAESNTSEPAATAGTETTIGPSARQTTGDVSRNQRSQSGPKTADAKPDQIIVDGETIYMGNTKITPEGDIETPDSFIDENGIRPKTPNAPNTRPVVIPPIDTQYMTPRQRRRLQEILRRHRVTVAAPSPTPPKN